jgi:hypothetical protein
MLWNNIDDKGGIFDTNITAAIMLLVTQDNRWAGST